MCMCVRIYRTGLLISFTVYFQKISTREPFLYRNDSTLKCIETPLSVSGTNYFSRSSLPPPPPPPPKNNFEWIFKKI